MRSLTRVVKSRFVRLDGRAAELRYQERDPDVSERSPARAGTHPGKRLSEEELSVKAREAERLVADARAKAEGILAAARKQAEALMEQAKAQGYRDGQKGGLESAHIEMGEAVTEISALLHSLEEQKAGMLKNYEGKIRDLAIHIAKKVIQSEMDRNSEVFLSIYKSAVQELHDQEWIRLSVSDLQVQFATENADTLMSLAKGAKHIEIVSLPEAPAGTCIVETPRGIVDASLDTQMDKIKEAFAGVEVLIGSEPDEDKNLKQIEGCGIDL